MNAFIEKECTRSIESHRNVPICRSMSGVGISVFYLLSLYISFLLIVDFPFYYTAAVSSVVIAATELEKLPLSFKALQKVLSNLVKSPENPKYRKLRLENKKVKELFDFESVLNVLTSVGFVRKQYPREQQHNDNETTTTSQTEEVLILEGEVHVSQIKDLLDVFEGLSPQQHADENEVAENKQDDGKRIAVDDTDTVDDAKKQRT